MTRTQAVNERPGYEASDSPDTCAIFEFGHGFHGNTYTSVLSGLTLTPGPPQIFCNCGTTEAKESWSDLGTGLTCVARMAHDCKLL